MATERYLLEELSPELREAFEEHMFECPECALDVRAGNVFLSEAKEQLPETDGARRGAGTGPHHSGKGQKAVVVGLCDAGPCGACICRTSGGDRIPERGHHPVAAFGGERATYNSVELAACRNTRHGTHHRAGGPQAGRGYLDRCSPGLPVLRHRLVRSAGQAILDPDRHRFRRGGHSHCSFQARG